MFNDTAIDRVKLLRPCSSALKSWFVVTALLAACAGAPEKSVQATPPPRQLGSWTGNGNTTLGFTSESGSFRVDWWTRNLDTQRPGTFQLTLRSGISGRSLQVLADHEGSGSGAVEFGDDPRLYEFLVESNGVEWSIAVHETYAAAPRKR